jgi:hypothetical protein
VNRRTLHTSVVVVGALLLGACGSSNGGTTASPITRAVTTTTEPWACGPSESDCTPEEVAATVALLYETAGATATEAECIAQVSAQGATAVNHAFGNPTAEQTRYAIACVGSEARLREISTALADDLVDGIPDVKPGTDPDPDVAAAGICAVWRQAARAASAVFFANNGRYPTTFEELTTGPRPALDLQGDARASGTVLTPTREELDWMMTMSVNGAEPPTFTCDPST